MDQAVEKKKCDFGRKVQEFTGLMAVFLVVWMLPEFVLSTIFLSMKQGVSEAVSYMVHFAGYLIGAVILAGNVTAHVGKSSGMPGKGNYIRIFLKCAMPAFPYGAVYAVVWLVLRRISMGEIYVLAINATRNRLIAVILLGISALIQSGLLMLMYRIAAVEAGKTVKKSFFVKILPLFLLHMLLWGIAISGQTLFFSIPFVGMTFLSLLVYQIVHAAVSAALLKICCDLAVTSVSDTEAGADGESLPKKAKEGLIAGIVCVVVSLAVLPIGIWRIGRTSPFYGLQYELTHHLNNAYMAFYQGQVAQGIQDLNIATADIELWSALTKKEQGSYAGEQMNRALQMGSTDVYFRVLNACGQDDPEKALKELILVYGIENADCDMAYLRFFAAQEAKLAEQGELSEEKAKEWKARRAIRDEILARQLNRGNYVDSFVTVAQAVEKLDAESVSGYLEALSESVPEQNSAIPPSVRLYIQAMRHNGATKEDCFEFFHLMESEDADDYMPLLQSYFMGRLLAYAYGEEGKDRYAHPEAVVDRLLEMAEEFPDKLLVQFMVTTELAQIDLNEYLDGLQKQMEQGRYQRGIKVIQRTWELYEKEYQEYQSMSEEDRQAVDAWATYQWNLMGHEEEGDAGYTEADYLAVRRIVAMAYSTLCQYDEAAAMLEGVEDYDAVLQAASIYNSNHEYQKAIDAIDKVAGQLNLSDMEKARLDYQRAIAYIGVRDFKKSVFGAAELADVLRDTENGEDRVELENMLISYSSRLTYRGNGDLWYPGFVYSGDNRQRMIFEELSEEEKQTIRDNEYLGAYVLGMKAWLVDSKAAGESEESRQIFEEEWDMMNRLLQKDGNLSGLWYIRSCYYFEKVGVSNYIDWETDMHTEKGREDIRNVFEAEDCMQKAVAIDTTNAVYLHIMASIYDLEYRYYEAYKYECLAEQYFRSQRLKYSTGHTSDAFVSWYRIEHVKSGLEGYVKNPDYVELYKPAYREEFEKWSYQ